MLDTLASDGPFTVFAPTDEAFAKVPKEALDALLADPSLNGDVGFIELDIKASNGVIHVIDGVLIPPIH